MTSFELIDNPLDDETHSGNDQSGTFLTRHRGPRNRCPAPECLDAEGGVSEPIKTTVVRYKCPYCNRHRAKRDAVVEHIARCWKNPATRSCLTCQWRVAPYSEPEVGYNEPEGCELEYTPPAFPTSNCPGWELAEGRSS